MKKFLFILFGVFVIAGAFAAGENIPTSKSYVDSKLGEKQDIIPANDGAARVLINTGTAGEYGTKGIYDSTGEYASQTQNLVDAATMNAGVQNAIDSEFQCIEYDENNECLLMQLGGITQVPAGYTQLKYLESTGTQWIDTGMKIGPSENISVKFAYTTNDERRWFGAIQNNDYRSPGFFFTYISGVPRSVTIYTNNSSSYGYATTRSLELNQAYTLKWHGSPFTNPEIIPSVAWYSNNIKQKYFYTPTNNSYLFTANSNTTITTTRPMRIYHFEVKGKINFIPARRNSDGVLGMYDTVSNTFFTNAGTGEFIAGPIVYLPTGE